MISKSELADEEHRLREEIDKLDEKIGSDTAKIESLDYEIYKLKSDNDDKMRIIKEEEKHAIKNQLNSIENDYD